MSITKSLYALAGTALTLENTYAALDFGARKAEGFKGWTAATGEEAIINLVKSFLQFVTIIAVIYCLWAGFQILTAGGDEEKVKTGRKIIINVIIGIVVMWLAYAVVTWVIAALV